MQMAHIALWTQNLEGMKYFYVKFFEGTAGSLYVNSKKGFESYFIHFKNSPGIEIMRRLDITKRPKTEMIGFTHIAFKVRDTEEVRAFTKKLKAADVPILCEPRFTGDGCFESAIADPDGNRIELVAESSAARPAKDS